MPPKAVPRSTAPHGRSRLGRVHLRAFGSRPSTPLSFRAAPAGRKLIAGGASPRTSAPKADKPRRGDSLCVSTGLGYQKVRASRTARCLPQPAFTLVELLVTLGILAILITIVITIGGSAFGGAQKNETQAVLLNLQAAIEQFRQDAPLRRVTNNQQKPVYVNRYGDDPCDELNGFLRSGGNAGVPVLPGHGTRPFLGPGGASARLHLPPAGLSAVRSSDFKALALVIKLYTPEAAAMLDRIEGRYRKTLPNPVEFFDRNGNDSLDMDDEPLFSFVDSWGNPIEYFATRNIVLDDKREKASKAFVEANLGKPLLVSYGPNGREQIAQLPANTTSPIVEDFAEMGPGEHKVDQPLNADNVYPDDALNERLTRPLVDPT